MQQPSVRLKLQRLPGGSDYAIGLLHHQLCLRRQLRERNLTRHVSG